MFTKIKHIKTLTFCRANLQLATSSPEGTLDPLPRLISGVM